MTSSAELDGLARELAVARATDLARAGRYDQAAALLAEDTDPAALDLLARIRAQQGRLAEAEDCWTRAAAAGGSGFEPERERVAALRRRRIGTSRWLRWALLALLALAVLAALVLLLVRPADDGAELAELRAQQDAISGQLGDIESRLAAPPAPAPAEPTADLDGLAAELSAPAVVVRPEGEELVVSFPVAPFDASGVGLTPEGAAALDELAAKLASRVGEVAVRVVGHTDDVPPRAGGPYADNAELGLARALAAAQRLSASSGVPLDGFAVASAGELGAPFPNTDDANRARNRTVTITVTPSG